MVTSFLIACPDAEGIGRGVRARDELERIGKGNEVSKVFGDH